MRLNRVLLSVKLSISFVKILTKMKIFLWEFGMMGVGDLEKRDGDEPLEC